MNIREAVFGVVYEKELDYITSIRGHKVIDGGYGGWDKIGEGVKREFGHDFDSFMKIMNYWIDNTWERVI